ncbi:MAG: tRNA (N6-isopentenyl adenosine(37)-C2)-methylthiotransferase MiaB [Lachnospiraceae bacterium]|nr:tRNA (N6-isopentenyl adenosine(37)-C2)-methylthiotransferase MiaB [Lachnospiraceae bacterium]
MNMNVSTDMHDALKRASERVRALSDTLGRTPTACVITFGCQMNARDSEKLAGILETAGYRIVEEESADYLIYNTCTVRENADNRLFGRLGAVGSSKKNSPWKKIAVCGCMMQESINVDRIRKSYPFVDLIFGTHNLYTFPALLDASLAPENEGSMLIDVWNQEKGILEDLPSRRKYPFKSGVNIMFGCNNFCTYCIVPYVRGRERSRKRADILEEIRRLADDGVIEIMLLGQNVNSYGLRVPEEERRLYGDFPSLLSEAARIPGIQRVRFMTSHPKDLSDDLIEVIRENPVIARHIHLPLQSGSDRILKRMNRIYTKEKYLTLAEKIRNRIPDAAITTDLIVGFPGETPADVDETIDVVEKVRFQNAFTFIYSRRTGTPAAAFEDQVSRETAQEGFDRLLGVVQRIAREETAKNAGREGLALVETVNENDPLLVTARLSDNLLVHFPGSAEDIGKMIPVRLEEACGFYYLGKRVARV